MNSPQKNTDRSGSDHPWSPTDQPCGGDVPKGPWTPLPVLRGRDSTSTLIQAPRPGNAWWQKLQRSGICNVLRLVRLRGTSERVARGFALGLVVNFFPTFGFGVLVSGGVARVLGGHFGAGLLGGALLCFAWPLLFYLNVKMGSMFYRPPLMITELEDVTKRAIDVLIWGKTFLVGAVVNSLLVGGSTYLLMRQLYEKLQPAALRAFRHFTKLRPRRSRGGDQHAEAAVCLDRHQE